ncbi:MAG: hypothetical protein A2V88_08820 [Elusimicrobia bacterium RBG_16_66_12]|nr:MAG: hypothetical protein A2V88_08820 [Elusimicrobia bacterium RBG_16_66_12]
MAERNDKAHDRIEIEVKRVNGDGTQAFRLWRAEFTGQMKGAAGSGKVVWAAIAVTAGPLTAIVMKLLEK